MEPGSAASARRRAELLARGIEVHGAAVALLRGLPAPDRDVDTTDDVAEINQPASSELRLLDGQLAILGGMMRECLVTPETAVRPQDVVAVSQALHDIHAVRFAIHDHLGHDRLRRLGHLDHGLSELRQVTDQDKLLDEVCEAAGRAGGFERVMLSRVDGDTWRPWRSWAHEVGSTELTFRDWIREVPAIELSQMLLESEMVRDRQPALVADAGEDPRVHAPMAHASGLTSYAAAPILAGDRVIGLLHADNAGAEMVDLDRDILWFFAIGFAQIFERAVLLDRLGEQRSRVLEAMRDIEAALDDLATSTIDLTHRDDATAVGVSRTFGPAPSTASARGRSRSS
ncbi:GAF domain-containing protein [Nocardioides sambongensis]|uniref:GAF domain-containing protein n=1 Tax=Nocardioides sambongensis TaxID=2589074 RepID=UPI0015E8302C|nr:GAF domain-containing protein [Nocardioides sambongensis]